MPSTHRDQNYHRHQTVGDDAIIPAGEALDLEARAENLTEPAAGVDAGWLRLRTRDGYLLERAAAGGSVQAVEHMAMRPPSGAIYLGDGNIRVALYLIAIPQVDLLYAIPFVVPFRLQIDAVAFRVNTQDLGNYIQFGLYDAVPDESFPRNLLQAFGPEELSAGVHTLTWETTLEPGYYFWCYNTDSATAKLGVHSNLMKHVLHVTNAMEGAYTCVYYTLPYANGMPETWRENDEALTYLTNAPWAFGTQIA